MSLTNPTVAEVVESLGGHVRSDESKNLEVLANEILILRAKVSEADAENTRLERKLGAEVESRGRAERRAVIAEDALANIGGIIGKARVAAAAAGAPLTRVGVVQPHANTVP